MFDTVISDCFVPYETFSYQERLLQQNGDRRKRDGRENCMYMNAVSYKDMFAPPPLPSPPQCDKKSQLASLRHFLSPPHTPSPHLICDNFQQPRKKLRMASNLEVVSMIAEIGQQQWSYTNFGLSDRTLRSRVRIFEISQELVKICAAA